MHPIVLVHGIFNPDSLLDMVRRWNIPLLRSLIRFQYFKGVAPYLVSNGFKDVLAPTLDLAAPSAERAGHLKEAVNAFLSQTGAEKVNLIAQSMGGLDSRRMIVDLGMADKVASLTTIGTLHLGTILADHVINDTGGDELIRVARKLLKLDLKGGIDLTEPVCAEFNRRAEDAEAKNGVFYQTYSSEPTEDMLIAPLLLTYRFILEKRGPNDTLVPVDSQRWTDKLRAEDGTEKRVAQKEFPFPADHFNQFNWWTWKGRGFSGKREAEEKVKAIYLEIARSVQHL
jgi:triacylglycerol lipase